MDEGKEMLAKESASCTMTLLLLGIILLVNLQFPLHVTTNNHNQAPVSVLSSNLDVDVVEFSVTAVSPYRVSLSWKLSHSSSELYVKVIRRFIVFESVIAILTSDICNFTDRWVEYGTEYSYKIVVVDKYGNELAHSDLKTIITPVDENNPGAPKYDWTYYKQTKYKYYAEDYLQYDYENYTVFRYCLHGVNVTVAFDKNLSPALSSEFMYAFATHVFTYFHRHWTVYRSFPINEYRIVVRHGGSTMGENELGLQYGEFVTEVGLGERLSHEIGHAWIGGILQVERNLPDGEPFDPETQDSDKWIIEGFEHFYGIIQLGLPDAEGFLEYDLSYYRKRMVEGGLDKPLVDLPVYFGTPFAYTYYCKGGLVAYLINEILIKYDNKTLNDFMRHLYRKYNITIDEDPTPKLISTEDLLKELKEFSSYNFTEFFEKYVYGTEELPIEDIDPQLISMLQNFSEVIPTMVNMASQAQPLGGVLYYLVGGMVTIAIVVLVVLYLRRRRK